MLIDKWTFYKPNCLGEMDSNTGKLYLGISLTHVLSIFLPRNIDITSNNYIFNYGVSTLETENKGIFFTL